MNKQALIKLAQVRLAINHVLRQRMVKQATEENYLPPPVSARIGAYPYELPRGAQIPEPQGIITPGEPYHPIGWTGPINENDPQYQAAKFRDAVGPIWNWGLDQWDNYRQAPMNKWIRDRDRAISGADPWDRADVSAAWASRKPQKVDRIPKDLYMHMPFKIHKGGLQPNTYWPRYKLNGERSSN